MERSRQRQADANYFKAKAEGNAAAATAHQAKLVKELGAGQPSNVSGQEVSPQASEGDNVVSSISLAVSLMVVCLAWVEGEGTGQSVAQGQEEVMTEHKTGNSMGCLLNHILLLVMAMALPCMVAGHRRRSSRELAKRPPTATMTLSR